MTRRDRIVHFFLALAILALFACLSGIASAGTANAAFAITRPTAYADGTALPAANIASYPVACMFTPTGGSATACTFTPTSFAGSVLTGSVALTVPPDGGRACFTLKTHLVNGVDSDPGAEACKDVPAVKPNAPGYTITITLAINLESDTPIRVAVADPIVTKEQTP